MSDTAARPPLHEDSRFGELDLDVVIELCRIRMTAGDVASLSIKDVVPLFGAMDGPVALVVRNREIARGELALENGSLALRISQVQGRRPSAVPRS